MRFVISLLFLILSAHAIACQCAGGCLDGNSYGLLAVIKIIEEDPNYLQAYKAQVIKVKNGGTVIENKGFGPDGRLIEPNIREIPEYITVVEAGLRVRAPELESSDGVLEEVIFHCGSHYEVGAMYYFFGNWVQEDIWEAPPCSCTERMQ